jgi:DNA-binding XRE family transcriptional regulator
MRRTTAQNSVRSLTASATFSAINCGRIPMAQLLRLSRWRRIIERGAGLADQGPALRCAFTVPQPMGRRSMTSVRELSTFCTLVGAAFKEPRVVAADTRPWVRGEIAGRFKCLRRRMHLTQEELGRHIHADRKTICRIENLRAMPGPRTWHRFEEYESKHNQPEIVFPENWLNEVEELVAGSACRQMLNHVLV